MRRADFQSLIPSVYRYQDEHRGRPLAALLKIMEENFHLLEEDLDQLYEDCFIETCRSEVIPYIASLVGLHIKGDDHQQIPGLRSVVANALANRRRKGTLPSLEKLLAHASGWGITLSETMSQLGVTQRLRPQQSHKSAPPGEQLFSLKSPSNVLLGSPFEKASRTLNIHGDQNNASQTSARGPRALYVNIWRIQALQVMGSQPKCLDPGKALYSFDPFGLKNPLFKLPIPWEDPNYPGDISTVPGPLLSQPMIRNGQVFRAALAQGQVFHQEALIRRRHYSIYLDDERVPEEHIKTMNLQEGSQLPPQSKPYPTFDNNTKRFPNRVAVDPENGLLMLNTPRPKSIRVDYSYGNPSHLGGGPYDRRHDLSDLREVTTFISQKSPDLQQQGSWTHNLGLSLLRQENQSTKRTIRIMDSSTYTLPDRPIHLQDGEELRLESANGSRPCLHGDIHIRVRGGARLVLNGFWLSGKLRIEISGKTKHKSNHLDIVAKHLTILPRPNKPAISACLNQHAFIAFTAERCIFGGIHNNAGTLLLHLADSIVDGDIGAADSKKAFCIASFLRTTVIGECHIASLGEATDSIFAKTLLVRNRTLGALRYCYFPAESLLPKTYQCIAGAVNDHPFEPHFDSLRFGDPNYCRLSQTNTPLFQAAENGNEIGVYHHLGQHRRFANLQSLTQQYLPLGIDPIFRFIS